MGSHLDHPIRRRIDDNLLTQVTSVTGIYMFTHTLKTCPMRCLLNAVFYICFNFNPCNVLQPWFDVKLLPVTKESVQAYEWESVD